MTNPRSLVQPNCHSSLEQRCLQLKKRRQQLVRLDDVAFAVALVRVNDPAAASRVTELTAFVI